MSFDFSSFALSAHIEAVAKQCFQKALVENPNESFFAFALTTTSDRDYVSASLNSAQNLDAILANIGEHSAAETQYYKWFPNEWGRFEYYSQEPGGIWRDVDKRLSELLNASEQVGEFSSFRKHVVDAMISALASLDRQGCFGEGDIRKARIIFADVYDDKDSEFVRGRSVPLLNAGRASTALVDEFLAAG